VPNCPQAGQHWQLQPPLEHLAGGTGARPARLAAGGAGLHFVFVVFVFVFIVVIVDILFAFAVVVVKVDALTSFVLGAVLIKNLKKVQIKI